MGIFDRFYYGKAGKRDYTEMDMPKNRVSLFFLVLKDHFFDLVKVNLMQLPFWLPFMLWTTVSLLALQSAAAEQQTQEEAAVLSVLSSAVFTWLFGLIPCIAITGPSSAGAAYIMRNWARDQHAFLWSDFKDAFKNNWKQALLLSSLTAFLPIVLYAAFIFYGHGAKAMPVLYIPLIAVLSMGILFCFMLALLYPMMVGYQLRFTDLLKNAVLMSAAQLPRMLLARLITAVPIAVLFVGIGTGNAVILLIIFLYYLVFGFALSRLVYASIANAVFDIYLNPRIEGAPVRQGLRPQEPEEELDDEEDAEDDEDDDE